MSYRKNVFVLGAGFSADAGAPLMNDFLRCSMDLRYDPNSPLTSHDKEIFHRILEYRFGLNRALAKIHVDLDNIEELFGFLEMELQLSAKLRAELRNDIRYLIVRTLEVSTDKAPGDAQCALTAGKSNETKYTHIFRGNRYAFFLGLASGLWNPTKCAKGTGVDSVITFNYDLVLEREMPRFKILPDYCCGGSAGYSPDGFKGSQRGVTLLKLHGSVNWLTCPQCKRLLFLGPEEAQIGNVGKHACVQCREFRLEPLIVPPTWNKGTEGTFIRSVWSRALEELMTAGRLFIVGYSFPQTDQFFRYMLGLAFAYNDQLSEVYIVNRSAGVWDKFEKLFNPYFRQRVVGFQQDTASNFITGIQSTTRQEIDAANLDSNFVRV